MTRKRDTRGESKDEKEAKKQKLNNQVAEAGKAEFRQK